MKKREIVFLCILVLCLQVFGVFATQPEGGVASKGIATTATADAANSDVAQGGFILDMNLSVDSQTHFWQGYYGSIFGNIVLEDSSGNLFYKWNWNNTDTGEIYAAENSSFRWNTVVAGNVNNVNYVGGSGTSDSAADTFKLTSTWTVANKTVSSVPAVRTYNASDLPRFEMGLLSDGGNSAIVATLYNNERGFNNQANETIAEAHPTDYQIMVPVNETSSVTYYFWVELN